MRGNINCIVLIDDDHANNFSNKRLIDRSGVCDMVKVYDNGENALIYLHEESLKGKESPEIIFIDIKILTIKRLEFLEAFKGLNFRNKDKVFIVGLTNSPYSSELKRSIGTGCNLIVHKPLILGTLKGIVRQYKNKR